MRQWQARADVEVTLPGDVPFTVEFEYVVNGVDEHAAGVEADDIIQAEIEAFNGHGVLESLEIEEL